MSKKLSSADEPLHIIVDSREQTPFDFSGVDPRPVVSVGALKTGDYSIRGMENYVAIERKSLVDLFGSCGQGRDRFEREFVRLKDFQFAALVIESDLYSIYKTPPSRSRMDPKTIMRTLIAWHMRYNVKIWPCPTRGFAETLTYLLLKRFDTDVKEGKIIIDEPF